MLGERYVEMTVECPRCQTKQKIHVAVRTRPTQAADELIQCINCGKRFRVSLPDKIVDGPFPA